MKKTNQLLLLCKVFEKRASLEGDMAKRIMLSVIPGVAGQLANSLTGGFPDLTALKLAVEGARDIIVFGTKACVDEMEFYGDAIKGGGSSYYDSEIKITPENKKKKESCKLINKQAHDEYAAGRFMESLSLCIKGFSDYDMWAYKYGGQKWEKIAKTIFTLAQDDNRLKHVRSLSDVKLTPEQRESAAKFEMDLMKNIVVHMNVFDGLMHNNGSIFEKMVSMEHTGGSYDANGEYIGGSEKTLKRIKKLMDAKELTNPVDVFIQIEKALQQSGQSGAFKDWVHKLRQHPDFKSYPGRSDKVKLEMLAIKNKKQFMPYLEAPMANLSELVKLKNQIANHSTPGMLSAIGTPGSKFFDKLTQSISDMREFARYTAKFDHVTSSPVGEEVTFTPGGARADAAYRAREAIISFCGKAYDKMYKASRRFDDGIYNKKSEEAIAAIDEAVNHFGELDHFIRSL